MTYSVTCIRTAPDIGFRSAQRHTAEGARDVATAFFAEGMQEIEVRDPYGNLRSFADLDRMALDLGDEERGLATRMAALA